MTLVEYKKKRDFKKTAEPAGKTGKRKFARLSFVVQKHDATRLHYDFRLELDGVLKSWAVPKGPSFDTTEKRLAVEVEDHPLEYAKFEGRIPEGEYGAGEVIVWDRGTWTPLGDPHEGLRLGKLEFELSGKKLQGQWVLVRLHGRRERGSDKPNWLLIKRSDEFARPVSEYDVLVEEPQSVKSGRTLEDLQGKTTKRKPMKKAVKQNVTRRSKTAVSAKGNGQPRSRRKRSAKKQTPPKGASKGPMPADVDVELAVLEGEVPTGGRWLHEIKFDGYRLVARIAGGKAKLITRRHQDWTHRYKAIAEAAGALPVDSAVLDGELVALLPTGVSSFQALQNAGRPGSEAKLVYYVFDLLYLDEYDLRKLPLVERKEMLNGLLAEADTPHIRYSDHLEGEGRDFFRESCQLGLEGIISKRADRPYVPGRSGDWVKVKCLGREELVIGGFTLSTADRRGIGALIVGYFDQGKLVYAGRVGTGFNTHTLLEMRQRLEKLKTGECPFAAVPSKERGPLVKWVKPELVAEVKFGSWTNDGILRQPSFQGIREDKAAREVTRPASLALSQGDGDMPAAQRSGRKAGGSAKSKASSASTKDGRAKGARATGARATAKQPELNIEITHPERVLFPESGITKLGLANYYAQVAEWILPHVADRPLSLVRCPDGHAKGKCFYQKHAGPGTPKNLGRVTIEENKGPGEYVYVRDVESLLSLVQMSVLEIHPWGAKRDNIERPDRLTLDLDPAPDVAWSRVVEASFAVRELLDREYGLVSFLKTTGGKGLHVVAPLAPRRYDWDTVKEFCKGVAERLTQSAPNQYTTNMAKAARKGRIFVDYLRNDRGATAVCAYSTRAKAGAPVSTPLAWEELSKVVRSDQFNVENLPARLRSLKGDPWRDMDGVRQGIR